MQLKVTNGNTFNPLTLDLSNFPDVQEGKGMDPMDPAFREAIISHALLREGGVLALEDLKAKELVFPLKLNVPLTQLTNLVPNPSFEYDVQPAAPALWSPSSGPGWFLNVGATLQVVSTTTSPAGVQRMNVTTTNASDQQGAALVLGVLPAGTYTASMFVKGSAGGELLQMSAGITSPGTGNANLFFTATTSYVRQSATFTSDGVTPSYIVIKTQSGHAAVTTFGVDGVMVTAGATLQPYFDGDTQLAYWTGPRGNSTSVLMGGNSGIAELVAQLHQIILAPGATCSWQDDGMSQPTIFDLVSGQFDVEYNYREAQRCWLTGKLRLFSQPFGHTAAPRAYAAASGVGPLLMITPYASGGANILGATNAGYGGQQQPSGGVQYFGTPALAGDAPALLQVSYVGPLPNGASNVGVVPYVAVSLLPDQYYQPLITTQQLAAALSGSAAGAAAASPFLSTVPLATAPASQYVSLTASSGNFPRSVAAAMSFSPVAGASGGIEPTAMWAGSHRLFALARASSSSGGTVIPVLQTLANPLVQVPVVASITSFADWALYDLGTFSLRASEAPPQKISVRMSLYYTGGQAAADLAALFVLPDNSTWYLNPTAIQGSQYGWPVGIASAAGVASAPYTNTLLLDDTLGDQFLYAGPSQTFAPSPLGMVPSSARITQYTRGLIPRPDPRNGLPIIAILSAAQSSTPTVAGVVGTTVPGASWADPQNLRTMAQVNVVERTRYVLP